MTDTVVVTGGNRGIGHAAAAQFLDLGYRVVLLARDPAAGAAARDRLTGPVDLVVGDLATLDGVRAAAAALREACPRVDVLVHNAGVWPARRETPDGTLERAFVTNHLAPFLLNHLLDDRLPPGARVVQVSAGLYVKGRADPDRTPTGADFHAIRTYADTKLCNLMLVPLWARAWQHTGRTVNALHPGVVRTDLGARGGPVGLLLRLVKRSWLAPEQGARPVVRLAVDPAYAGVTGRYFDVDKDTPPVAPADDAALARRLWEQAARLTGVDLPAPSATGAAAPDGGGAGHP